MPVVGFVTMPALWGCAADLVQSGKAIFVLTVQRIGDPTYILAKLVVGSRLWGNICMCGGWTWQPFDHRASWTLIRETFWETRIGTCMKPFVF
jgi:hypothetical protein